MIAIAAPRLVRAGMVFQSMHWSYGPDAIIAKKRFPNGFTASVIRHETSYGGNAGLFEVMVELDGRLRWRHVRPALQRRLPEMTCDEVAGWLTLDEADALCVRISRLPSVQISLKRVRKLSSRRGSFLRRGRRFHNMAKYHVNRSKRRLYDRMVPAIVKERDE